MTQTARTLDVRLKRAYDPPSDDDGVRVLVDRLWPRGLRKSDVAIDQWLKEVAPSTELRRWFGHEPSRWPEFRRRYRAELSHKPELVNELRAVAREGPITLVFAARDKASQRSDSASRDSHALNFAADRTEAEMDDCDCQMVTTEQLKLLLESDRPEGKELAVGYLVRLLTSPVKEERERGYELFEEGINHALFCSCLNYRSLTGGFTYPLLGVLARTVESWVTRSASIKADESAACSRQP